MWKKCGTSFQTNSWIQWALSELFSKAQRKTWKQWITIFYDFHDSFMAWNLGPRLIATVWNSADKKVVKCNYGRQSQLLSRRLLSIYVLLVSPLCNSKIWSVEMFFSPFLQSSADTGNRVSLKLTGKKSQGLLCQSPKPLTFFSPLQHICASVITWFISYCMPKHTITQYWDSGIGYCIMPLLWKKKKKICKNQIHAVV